ncbi:ATP-binding cassette sub-family A member 13 [Petaurus breviceps papuanus]|uniref:ATP-binding cassette sub-family A member 13 n=1 Tax=Petaurus breviceps papuanus TaxID=3040969 RepID=UPI0036DC25F1
MANVLPRVKELKTLEGLFRFKTSEPEIIMFSCESDGEACLCPDSWILVLSLSEFLWPCTLFLILTVIRFQEPPRHRENCYLQPRNLPSQGVYPFVQSLLCNAGSRCKNTSYVAPKDPNFRIFRSPNSQHDQGMPTDLAFLEDVQELAQGISETMEKAIALQKLWLESSKLSGSHNAAFSMLIRSKLYKMLYFSSKVDLNKTETLISKIENLHHQPYFWDFLHSLPGFRTSNLHPKYGLQVLAHFLQTILSSLASLEDLDWLPINQTSSKAAQIGLNVTVTILEFLQEEKVEAIGIGYNLSLRNVVWNPLKLKSDLTSKYGFDDLHVEKMLNYTGELNEIPTDSSLEQFICSALYNTSEVEVDNNYNHGNCNIQWSEVKDYLVHSVNWLQIYKQLSVSEMDDGALKTVIQQWLNGSVVQKILTGMEQSLVAFREQYPEDSESWKVTSVLHTMIHLLDDSLGPESHPNYLQSPKILVYLAKFQTILQNLPHWPTVKRLLLVNGALRNVIIKNLHFIREVLSKLERLAPFSETDDLSSLQLEMDAFFRDLKQDGIFQDVLFGRINQPIAITEDFLGWQEIEQQLAESTKLCSWLYQSLSTQISPGEDISFVYCQEKIISTLVFHILEEGQFALEQNNSWKNLIEFLRKTCEVAHYVNKQENFRRGPSATSEKSPCKGAKLDWKAITDTYYVFLKNLLKSPRMSVSRILMYSKDFLKMEKKSHTYEDEVTNFWLSFVDSVEKMVLPGSLVSSNQTTFQNLASLTEVIWNKTVWWMNTSRSSEAEPSLNTQKFSEFSKEVIEKIQVVSSLWKRNEYERFLRLLELILYEINPKLLELWMYGIPKREKDKLETLSTLLNLSIPGNQRVLGKNFNFSLHFRNLSASENLNLDFVHLSEIVINSLHELGLVKQEQVTATLNTVYALHNISMLSSSFSVSQKQYLENILTQIYQNVFQDKDSVVLLRLYSSIYQVIYQFISSLQSNESLSTFFIKISKSISAIIKEFNFQDMSKAFEFLSEVTSFLDQISEESLCEKLFSVYNYLELQVKSLILKEGQETKMIHATLWSLKQLLIKDKNFRVSLLHYLNQLFNKSVEGHLNNQCFGLDDRLLSLNGSMDVRNSLILPWIQMLSNLTENIFINESLAMQCTFSWVQVWFEIWGAVSQVLKFDSKFFPSLQIGLRELSSEIGNSFEHFETCQRMYPGHVSITLIKSLLKNIVQGDDTQNWNALIGLLSMLDSSVAIMKSLNTAEVEKSLLRVENEVLKLKESPLNINISRMFFYSLFEVFMELNNTTGNIDRDSLMVSAEQYETAFTVLQETIRFFRNISYNQDLLSCAGILQNATNLGMESDLASKNTSQKLLSVLAILKSILTSEDIISRLEGCTAWIDIIKNLGGRYNTISFGYSQDFLELFLSARNINNTKIKVRKMLDFVTFILSSTKPLCSLNNSDLHCLDVYFRHVTNVAKVAITSLFEKEKIPMLDFILMILNNSEDQIRVIINNLTRTLEFSSDISWKNFTELIMRALEKSDNSPNQFQIVWRQSVTFFREIQKLVKNITIKILENNSSDIGKVLKVFTNLPKEKSANLLGDSIQNLGSYFAFNLSHDLQNLPIHAVMKAIGLDIQLARDVMNSLLPSILPNIPQNSGNMKVLKKVSTLIHNLKNVDIELLVDQLEQISGSLRDFLKNISALEDGNLGIDLVVGLMETFVHSSHSWNVNHLWQLSRLFPKDEVDAVVDAYYVLPDGVRLLQRIAHRNITEALLEVYNFALVHGGSISNVTKEDFASAIKGLLDITELVIDKPNIAAEALSCFPVTWCSSHPTLQFHKDMVVEKCNAHKSVHPLLYSKMAELFHHLQLMPLEDDLQCSNESVRIETTHKVYCFFHEVAAWNSILIHFSEVLHVNNSLLKELQGFWYKLSPYILSSGKSSNANDSIHCAVVPGKWIALRVIEKLKKRNFTKALSVKDILKQLTGLNKIQHWNVDKETSVLNKTIMDWKRWTKLVSSSGVENMTFFLSPLMHLSSIANQINDLLKVLLSFGKTSHIIGNLEALWFETERSVQDLWKNFSIRHIFSSVKQGIQIIKSLADQNTTLPLSYSLKQFNSSFLYGTRLLEDLVLVTRDLLHEYTNGNFFTIINTLILALTNESSPHAGALNIGDITDFLEYFKNVSREGNITITRVAHLLNLKKQTNFSDAQFLFENSLISAINNFAWSSLEAALHSNDTDLLIRDFIDLVFNYTQFENNKGNLSLHSHSTMELFKQFFLKFFFPPKGNFENKIFVLLKDIYTDIMGEISIAPEDKILELLKLDPFTYLKKEGRLPSNSSSLRENIYDLIKDSFTLEDDESYFDTQHKLKFIRDLVHVILRATPIRKDIGNDAELGINKTHLLSKMNNFEDLLELNEDLDSAVQLVRKNSAKIVSLMDIIFSYHIKDLHAFSSTLQVVLTNLTELVTFVGNVFPSKERKAIEITKRLLDIIAQGEKDIPEGFLEMSQALTTLLQDIKKLRDLSQSIDAMVKFLHLAKKVSAQVASILETRFISMTKGKLNSLDMLYSFLQEAVHNVVDGITSMRNLEPLSYQEVEILLKPLLDVTSWTLNIKPIISKEFRPLNISTSSFSYLSQSKNISEIVEEIAVFIINSKNHSVELEHLVLALKNTTQTLSIDAKTLMGEVLDCLVPINNLTSQVNFLNSNMNSSHRWLWDTKWERLYKMVLFWNEILSQNSPESGAKLKMVIALSLEALGNNLQKAGWDIFNLLLTFAQHPNNLSQAIESPGKMLSVSGGEFSKALFFNSSTIHNMTHQELEKAIQVALNKIALWMEWLLLHHSLWRHSTKALFPFTWETSVNVTTGKGVMSKPPNNIKGEKNNFSLTFKPSSCFEKSIKRIISLAKYWQKGPLQNQSVLEICQFFQKHLKPSTALTLQKVKMTILNVLIILSEDPAFTKDILCTLLSCKDGLIRHLLLSIVRGITLVHGHYQDFETIWSSSSHGHCESLLHTSSKLSNSLESFKRSLENATARDCECHPMLETVQQHMKMLARSLEKPLSGDPIMAFLSNFSVTGDVRVKDCVQNVTKLTEELRSLTTISEKTINSILEANISHSKFLSSALTVALAGKCDEEVISLLLTFPADGKALAVRELCVLPASDMYTLIVLISQNLDLQIIIYKMLIPPEANSILNSLLDVVSSIDFLLTKAQHILKYLPEFLRLFKSVPLFDIPEFPQFSQDIQSRSSAFGSLQSVMKMVCKEASFLSNSNMFISLPRVNDLLEDDKTKFNIPKDSTPFCLKLYQEILQSPNGALVWAFLKPLLHGKILYTPNTSVINKVIEKANYTFVFVDKLKIALEAMLKMSSVFQNGRNAQMINRLQEALRNTFIKNFVESQLQIDVEKLTVKLQNYTGMLGKMFNHSKVEQFHSLAQIMVNISSCVLLNRFQPLESVEILEREAHGLMQQNNLLASIIFNSSLTIKRNGSDFVDLPHHVIYTIRTSVLYSMRTDLVKNPLWKFHPQSLPADGFKYNHIFVPLQDIIERAIILVQTGLDTLTPPIQAQAMPYPCHTSDLFLNNVGFFFPLIMMLTWMVSVASMVRKLVYEREIRLEEYMRMMGVHPTVHFLAWFLENIIMLIISSCALAIILKTSGIFVHSNAFIIFLFLLDFGVSIVMLSFLLSAFFSSANTAALCTSLVYMISFLPYIVLLVLHNQLSFAIQTVLCFLSTTAFGQGVFFITFLEGQEAGIQWNNMYQSLEQEGDMTFGWVCWMILFDSMVYFICGWYFSNLIPGNFGLKKPWYFPFTMSYWKNLCGLKMRKQQHITSNLFFFNEHFLSKGSLPPNRQKTIEDGVHAGVILVSVTKEYESDKKAAVKELTLKFYKGQITALLGPNGAGKTTIISLLTGLYPPSSGTIIINGKDMQTQLAAIRMEMGVCPQYDVLFDNLSVREHLLLFASIKAPLWTKKELYQQVNKTLQDVELTQHQHKHIRALSGGMKRKLSIGIAFIGNSNVVVLDEPTSGVDPCARRGIWDILLKYRAGRTLIFTTHHLDEAEVLSDRIAILQHGRLRCSGSPSSLKEAYGHGFSLTLTKQPLILEIQDGKDIDQVTSLIQIYIPQAFLKENGGTELTYAIPKDTDKACFKGLFQALDQNLHHLHLTGYGISDTTLEECLARCLAHSNAYELLKRVVDTVGDLLSKSESPVDITWNEFLMASTMFYICIFTINGDILMMSWPKKKEPLDNSHRKIKPNQGGMLLLTQMAALLMKRFHHTRRGWKGTLSDLVLPVLFVALAMGLFMVKPLVIDYPSLKLTPGHYDSEEAYFFSSESEDTGLSRVLLRSFSVQDPLCANFRPDLKNFSCWRSDPFTPREFQDSCACLKCPKKNTSAPYLKNSKGNILFNLSAFDVEEYLLWPSKKPRLGGWSFGVKIPDQGQDTNINMSKPQTLAKVWYNQKGFHALPSYLNHLNNLILWQYLPPSVNWRQYGIILYSHPYGGTLLNEDKILESVRQCGVALCIMLGFSILTASIGSSVVKDRVCGAKRLQHISGLGYRTYWFTNFIYDMVFYLVSVSLSIGVIVAFKLTAFTFRENLAATALLLALFGYATLPWMYLLSRIFSSSDVAFISYISLNFIFGLCTMLMTIMPRLLAVVSKAQNLQDIYNVLKWVFTIFPQFCLGQGLIELCYNQIKFDLTHNFGIDSYVSPFEMNFLGWIFVAMALQGTTLLLSRILLHWDLLQKPRSHPVFLGPVTPSEDMDVKEEQMRIWTGRTDSDILVLRNLRKSYPGFGKRNTAVNDISLGIPRGECFGLLGVNGAGKSTTFKMLTGDIIPSSGYAAIRNPRGDEMVLPSCGASGILIGYCPQKDALDEFLTGWEHLHYYCSLRGVPKQDIHRVAGELVNRLHLEAHIEKPVSTYSGGTKRKLSTALALVGKPELLLLDEPSSGMDPGSKRYLWKTIMKEVQEGCAAILTSHSMEECEALCTRLAIMVDGSFKCLGSPQHIKNRFGAGYTVKVWLSQETSQHDAISDCLKLHFPGIQFKGQHLNLLEYHVPQRWGCLADLFRVLENNKTLLNIKHYSINQTTLEQVFINFATQQQQTPYPTFESSTNCIRPHPVSI